MKPGDCRCGHMPGDHTWMGTGACDECSCESFREPSPAAWRRVVVAACNHLERIARRWV